MDGLLTLARERKINGHGDSTTKAKNGQKKKKNYVVRCKKGKGISIIIWAAIWGGGHTDIYRMNRIKESAQGGYSSRSYLQIIEYYLSAIWQPGMELMHNNITIYAASIIEDWHNENNILLVDWAVLTRFVPS